LPDARGLGASWRGRYGRCERIMLDELQRVPLVLRENGSGTLEVVARYLAAAGIRISSLRVVMRLGSTESIKAFVRSSDALAIVSVASVVDELRSGELRIVDMEGCAIRRDFSFVWPEGRGDALASRFVGFVRSFE
ncbi:MAG: LysR family transcriptional regulator, partial [Alistipes sp.]|nr:LysR family transcriptional regulator [Alistipes sp.]